MPLTGGCKNMILSNCGLSGLPDQIFKKGTFGNSNDNKVQVKKRTGVLCLISLTDYTLNDEKKQMIMKYISYRMTNRESGGGIDHVYFSAVAYPLKN